MSKIGLIIKREYAERTKKRSFILMTFLVPLIISGLVFLAMFLSIQETKQMKVLVVDPDNLCGGKVFIGDVETPPATFFFTQEEVGVDQFQHEERFQTYDMLLGVRSEVITNRTIKAYYRNESNARAEYFIRDRIELRLEEYFAMDHGLSLAEYREIRQEFNFRFEHVDEFREDTTFARGVGFVFAIIIFIFILTFASQVMRSVIEEKTSRVVEILVSSVRPIQLMLGKVIGIGLVGLTQFVVWIALIGLALFLMRSFVFQDMANPENLANAMAGLESAGTDILVDQAAKVTFESELITVIYNGIPWVTLLTLFTLYFIGGYLLYAGLFAVIGASVDSQSDSQQLMFPVILVLLFSFVVGLIVIFTPDGTAGTWFSQIPFSSPMVMLQRVAAGSVTLLEVIISILILTATFIVTLFGAAKVYRTGILRYGKKASWREIVKWLRN